MLLVLYAHVHACQQLSMAALHLLSVGFMQVLCLHHAILPILDGVLHGRHADLPITHLIQVTAAY